MGRRKYAATSIKGAELRVRFNVSRRSDGTAVGEVAMSGILTDAEGNDMPVVANRLIFQCEHGGGDSWQGVASSAIEAKSVEIRCDVCGHSERLKTQDLAGLFVLATDHEFCEQYTGAIGIGRHDGRPGAAYAIVNLKAAVRLVSIWRGRLAEDRAGDNGE